MVRYLTAAILGCLYVAVSILIVRLAGEAHRDQLNKPKLAPTELDIAPLTTKGQQDASNGSVAVRDITPIRPESVKSDPQTPPVADAPARSTIDHPSPAPPPSEVTKAVPAISPSAKNAAALPDREPKLPNPVVKNGFWEQPKLTHPWDVAHLSVNQERDLGADLHELIVHFNPLLENQAALVGRVKDAAEPFLKTLRRPEIHYKFFILNSDVVNAFSTPGGYVYISRGLFDLIGEDEDYALQFAVGHEIAHVDLEHAIKCLRDSDVMKMRVGTLQKLFVLILPFGYLRNDTFDQEFEADEWVAERMLRFQRTRREILAFLQKHDGYAKSHGFGDGRGQPRPGRDISPVENHFRAQTAASDRLKHLKAFMAPPAERPK
jgi:Peptidase family M48